MKWFYVLILIILIFLISEGEARYARSYYKGNSGSGGGGDLSEGALIGIIVGVLVVGGVITVVSIYFCCVKNNAAAKGKVGTTPQPNDVVVASNGYGNMGYSNYSNYSNYGNSSNPPPPVAYNPPAYSSPEYPPKKE